MNNKKFTVDELDSNMRTNEVVSDGECEWHSPLHAPFQMVGFPWFEHERKYRRLPSASGASMPAAVDQLADCTSGGQIRFRTNSRSLAIRVTLQAPAHMYHMPATGQSGFDCYIGPFGEQRYCSTTKFNARNRQYECEFFKFEQQEWLDITLYFPLYSGVEEVFIGLEKGAEVAEPYIYEHQEKVIFYGGSIFQGGCASRTGMSYTNILSRRFNMEFVNLGFSGNGKGEPELAQMISEIESPACFVLGYEGNVPSSESLAQTLPNFIRILRSVHTDTPILVISRTRYAREFFMPNDVELRVERRQIQEGVVSKFRELGDQNVHFFDGANLLGEDFENALVDGIHPTDLGFLRIADRLEPVLRELLNVHLLTNRRSRYNI